MNLWNTEKVLHILGKNFVYRLFRFNLERRKMSYALKWNQLLQGWKMCTSMWQQSLNKVAIVSWCWTGNALKKKQKCISRLHCTTFGTPGHLLLTLSANHYKNLETLYTINWSRPGLCEKPTEKNQKYFQSWLTKIFFLILETFLNYFYSIP